MSEQKGAFNGNGNCNRTACQQAGATWWNPSTQSYYCLSARFASTNGCH